MNLTLHNKAWRDIIDDREWWEKTLGTEDPEEFDEAVESYMGEGWEWNREVEVRYGGCRLGKRLQESKV
jgi:hypothetical protein